MSLLNINLLSMQSRYHKAACLVCASSALSGAPFATFSLVGQGGAGEQGVFLPPNPVSGKGTNVVHCRRPLVSLSCTEGCLVLARALWMAAAVSLGRHSTGFSSPVLFSCVVFICSWYLFTVVFIVKPAAPSTGFKLVS